MFLGTGSDVGKSVVTTAFCRVLKRRGVNVAPFKAQNMSNNSFVTLEGGEIGRAQVAQAEACGLTPSVDMNPVLLKPVTDRGSQVVLSGRVHGNMTAREYYAFKTEVRKTVSAAFQRLGQTFEAVVLEGAGSCAEVNLRAHDLVNFDMADAANAPVILVADIDRGGVFAQIVGTLAVISEAERFRLKGFLINKFRGDPDLFTAGVDYLEEKTGKPVFGVIPYLSDIGVDMEDSMSLDQRIGKAAAGGAHAPDPSVLSLAAVRLPHISNFTDLQVLEAEPDVTVTWLTSPASLSGFDAVIIPGSKSTVSDAAWMHRRGWKEALGDYAATGAGLVVGLCGGYQILGAEIRDPMGIEGDVFQIEGMNLLELNTEIDKTKIVRVSEGYDTRYGAFVRGYEIHMGKTDGPGTNTPLLHLKDGPDGANQDAVFGAYLHGLFDSGRFRRRFLADVAARRQKPFNTHTPREDVWVVKEKIYDRLAEHFENHVDVEAIVAVMQDGDRSASPNRKTALPR